jgi:2-polyprenyl-6-hydroxyphenyl methylase/3-demethylubiquinone-9 3-methyltransferase
MTTQTTNIDPREVAKFDALASRWWDAGSEFRPLHEINPLRLDYIDRHCGGLDQRQVLDVGCGGGILSESMALRGGIVTGIDMAPAPLEVARLHLHESGARVDYRQIAAEDLLGEQAGHWDVVTCMELLEHVPDPARLIQSCAELVRPGGHVFLSTINRNPMAYLQAIIGAEYLLQLLPRGTHDYARFIRPAEIGRWLRQAGLELQDMTGLSYNPLTRRYRLDRNIDVNYMLHARRPE